MPRGGDERTPIGWTSRPPGCKTGIGGALGSRRMRVGPPGPVVANTRWYCQEPRYQRTAPSSLYPSSVVTALEAAFRVPEFTAPITPGVGGGGGGLGGGGGEVAEAWARLLTARRKSGPSLPHTSVHRDFWQIASKFRARANEAAEELQNPRLQFRSTPRARASWLTSATTTTQPFDRGPHTPRVVGFSREMDGLSIPHVGVPAGKWAA